jgi:DNA-directed RNA polymerase subunit RPC12/RpoP
MEEPLLPLACPKCSATFMQTLSWLKEHPSFTCTNCGYEITFDANKPGAESLFREIPKSD